MNTSVLKNIYRVFENLTAIAFVFGHLKMLSSHRFFIAAQVVRQIHEYASELDDVDSDIELEVIWYKFGFTATLSRLHIYGRYKCSD